MNTTGTFANGEYVANILETKAIVNEQLKQRFVDFFAKPKSQFMACGVS
jgi:hypothetical protein